MSVSIYVGKDLTEYGNCFLAGYGDEPSSHYFFYGEGGETDKDFVEAGLNSEAKFPGKRIKVDQVDSTYRYITSRYTCWKGLPEPLENGGINENQVAAAAVWSPSRSELKELTPNPQKGVTFSDISKLVMERAESAEHAVEIAGNLIDKYGYATYGGNSHMFVDPDEGWIMVQLAGGKGLWAAKRLGSDEIRVNRPGYLGEFPTDFKDKDGFKGSDNLISFAEEMGWYDEGSDYSFNFGRVYQTDRRPDKPGKHIRAKGVEAMEDILYNKAPDISILDMMEAVRSPRITSSTSGYGKVAELQDERSELTTLWLASGPSLTSPFIPLSIGIKDIPIEFKKHRYLSKGEACSFIQPDFQGRESTTYAFRVFKRLYHLVAEYPKEFRTEVVDTLKAFDKRAIKKFYDVRSTAEMLYEKGYNEVAERLLTDLTERVAAEGLEAGEILSNSIELKTKLFYGISEPGENKEDSRLHATIDKKFYPWSELE